MSPLVLLAIRATELWTPLTIAASAVLAVLAVAGLLWGLSVGTSRYDRSP